jgi:hypothetical protein
MSPLSATTTPVGPLKCFLVGAGDARFPEPHQHLAVRAELPDLMTHALLEPAAPRGSPAGAPSVTHTLPSRSMKKPCGKLMRPLPKLETIFPSGSIG